MSTLGGAVGWVGPDGAVTPCDRVPGTDRKAVQRAEPWRDGKGGSPHVRARQGGARVSAVAGGSSVQRAVVAANHQVKFDGSV